MSVLLTLGWIVIGLLLIFSGCNLLAKMHWDRARDAYRRGYPAIGEREMHLGNRWAPWVRPRR